MKTLLALIFLSVLSPAPYLLASEASTPEADVRKADRVFAEAIAAKSLDRTLACYAPDAVTAGSAMFQAHTPAEFRTAWVELLAQPNYSLTWDTKKVVVTDSGSTAYSSGTWVEGSDHGPYLVVWQRQKDGQWKILIDAAWTTP